jgi:acetyl coenzyme A synthetase (ADP forming)-like protein
VASLPEAVDLAVIVVPAAAVVPVAVECGEKGVGGLVVITAGFRETGEPGRALEEELLAVVRRYGMRLVGPNCLGILNTDPEISLNATFAPAWPPRGGVAMSSQSGALGLAILDYASQIGLGISSFLSIGNKADVSSNDLIAYWEHDPETRVILLYLESFGNPRNFTELARRVGRKKPIVAVKSGRTRSGSRAATSHTGALAGSEEAVEAVLRSAGVIRTDTLEDLFDTALLLAHQPLPAGPRVAILTNAGGPGIMAADACEGAGLELPELSRATRERLRVFLPPEASLKNPVDMIASASAAQYERAVAAVMEDSAADALLVLFVPPVVTEARDVARAIRKGSEGSPKPILTCFLGTHGVPEGLRSLKAGHVPSYAFPEAAARALARAVRYAAWRARPEGRVPTLAGLAPGRFRAGLEAGRWALSPDGWLPPAGVEALLDAYGIARPASRVALSAEEAERVARELRAPYAVKLVSSRFLHKSDVGGVALGLSDAAAARRAAGEIRARLATRGDGGAFEGVLVQEMVTGGLETIVGMTRDPHFGPLLMFGLGGAQVEVLHDITFNVHPLTDVEAADMLERVRGRALLDGYRGAPPADRAALADLLLRVSQLVADLPEVQELDLNPVAALPPGQGVCVLDARVRWGAASAAGAAGAASAANGASVAGAAGAASAAGAAGAAAP